MQLLQKSEEEKEIFRNDKGGEKVKGQIVMGQIADSSSYQRWTGLYRALWKWECSWASWTWLRCKFSAFRLLRIGRAVGLQDRERSCWSSLVHCQSWEYFLESSKLVGTNSDMVHINSNSFSSHFWKRRKNKKYFDLAWMDCWCFLDARDFP